MARWLVVQPGPFHSPWDVYAGWDEALRSLGQQVHAFNLGDRLVAYETAHIEQDDGTYRRMCPDDDTAVELALNGLAAALWKIRPDVLFICSAFWWDPEMLDHARRAYGTTVVMHHTESPYEDDRQLMAAPFADLHLVNDPISVPRFQKICRAVYCPHAFRPSVHFPSPGRSAYRYDLAFAGTGGPSRMAFLEAMDLDGLDVLLAGNWMSLRPDSPLLPHVYRDPDRSIMDNAAVADMYRSMRCGISLFRREANRPELIEGHGLGPREVEMAACGAFFLRDPRPEADSLFPSLPAFTSPQEASELIRWWIHPDRDGARREAGAKAREAVKDRTFANHARQVMKLLRIE